MPPAATMSRARLAAARGSEWSGAAAAAAFSSLGAYLALELWRAKLSVPLRYQQVGDLKFYLGLVKSILENGWYQHNPSLGAPFGQSLFDFPQGADNLNLAVIKALGLLSGDYAVVTNLFFLSTFPLIGLTAYYALRRLRLRPAVASVCAVLFALLPFHFYRNESQVLLSAYYAVPLGACLFLTLFADEPLFARRKRGPRSLVWASRRTLETAVSCLVIGSAGLYYAVFTLLLLIVGLVVAAFARRPVGGGLVAFAVIAATLSVNLAPSVLYAARHGRDAQIARTPIESEQLGLRLSNLVLPVRDHRLGLLAKVNARYAAQTSPGYCESCNETLGAVGAVGFALLCLIGLAACAAGARGSPATEWQRAYRPAALGVAISFTIGTTGGISALIAFLITPDVRAWNRISVFIAFFSLLAAGLALEAGGRRLHGRGGRAVAGGLLGGVLLLGGLDETSRFYVSDYAIAGRAYRSDQAFGRLIQSRLGSGASVLELPYLPFPEGFHVPGRPLPEAFRASYEPLRPYLSTHGLRWSFGAIKGRPEDWVAQLAAKPLDVVVAAAAAAGFEAIYVDPRGYDPAAASLIRAGLTRLVGSAPLVSRRDDAWLFDLRPYLHSLSATATAGDLAAARAAALHPLRTACGADPGAVLLTNPARTARTATFSATLTAPLAGGVTLLIALPDGSSTRRVLGGAALRIHRRLTLPPGTSIVRFSILGRRPFAATAANPAFVVSQATLTDQAFAPLRRGGGGAGLPIAGLAGPTCSELYAASAAPHLTAFATRQTARLPIHPPSPRAAGPDQVRGTRVPGPGSDRAI